MYGNVGDDGFSTRISRAAYKRDKATERETTAITGLTTGLTTCLTRVTLGDYWRGLRQGIYTKRMKQLRKHTAGNLNQILKSEMAAGLTIDGSALSVNIVGLEGQDAALTQAIAAAEYVVCIIWWYPASRNANRDTNANATTRSLK